MDDQKSQPELDVQALVQRAIAEYVRQDSGRREPALKAELQEERRKREALERRLNQMAEENSRSREIADQAERSSKIRSELQSLGVTKIDLAYKAVQGDIQRTEDGRLMAKNENGEFGIKEYLTNFVHENPEFLPARIPGGTGLTTPERWPRRRRHGHDFTQDEQRRQGTRAAGDTPRYLKRWALEK